jgi:hypothetical protein
VVSLYDCWSTKNITRRPVNETSGWQIRRISNAAFDENGREFGIPVLSMIPGAYPGLEAEERGQGELSPEIYLKWYVLKCLLLPLLLVKELQVVH